MALLDQVIGALLAATYANSILFALEMVSVVQYYSMRKRNRDSVLIQAMISFTFFLDIVCTISTYACVYLYSVTHWGDPSYVQRQYWPFTVMIVTTSISAAIVQSFLIHRYWKMSSQLYVTVVLTLLMFAALGGSVETTVSVIVNSSYADRPKMVNSVTIWFSSSAAADIAIALALLWELSRMQSSFRATQSLIHQLMASTIRSGAATSMVAVTILITFLTNEESNVSAGFAFCLGRVYAITMLYNLNNRNILQNGSSGTALSGDYSTSMNLNGVYTRSTTVHHDPTIISAKDTKEPDILSIPDHSHGDSNLFIAQTKVSDMPFGP